MDHKNFDLERCYAPSKRTEKSRIEICNTILPVLESPMSPPDHEKGPGQDTLLVQPITVIFMRPTTYKTRCPTKMSVKYVTLAVWSAVAH